MQTEILYPSCDTEVGLAVGRIREITELASTSNATAVSISTKRKLSGGFLTGLLQLDKSLKSLGILLKVSISISTKYQGNEIEKGASSYLDRLETASTLRMLDIPSSVNLKPILPFIKASEYLEIVDDFIHSCENFMLGGLYLSKATPFGKSIADEYPDLISEKPVDWIPGKPIWTYCYDANKVNTIINYIRDRGGFGYLSDKDFVLDVLRRKQGVSHEK
jgi:DNA repair photolyase